MELATDAGDRILLDVGKPLDTPCGATGALPRTLDLTTPMGGILVSHPHQDHYGLLGETPASWPVYCGEATAKLITLTSGIGGSPTIRDFRPWRSGRAMTIGPFVVTPYLTDHSAFDSYMLLIEIGGKRVLYSGDFRTHGRKSRLVERMMTNPPREIDVFLMEGTNLGTSKPTMTEGDLEAEFKTLFRQTPGRVFVAWSAQNIDRTVTLYRACLQTGRTLVVDLYTAEVLATLAAFGRLPQPGWPAIKVVMTSALARMYRSKGNGAFVEQMVPHGLSATKLAQTPRNWVIMVRRSLINDYERAAVIPNAGDAWCWSMWQGYLKNADGAQVQTWLESGGARAAHIHTSGHASPIKLRAFAQSINPKWLVPIHGAAWDEESNGFPPIQRLADGEPLVL